MKILTWNVYKGNQTLRELLDQIIEVDADIACLQEVPEHNMEMFIKQYPYHASAKETWTERKSGDKVMIYNLILSKFELSDIAIEDISLGTIYASPKYSQFSSEFISASFSHDGTDYQICNAHLRCVAPPSVRIKQLQQIIALLDDSKEQLILGDLNTFSWPLLNILLWRRYKYTFKELLTNGRKVFDEIFKEYELKNPHKGQGTYKYFPVQYDYILVDKDVPIKTARKEKKLFGSDHYLLVAEIGKK